MGLGNHLYVDLVDDPSDIQQQIATLPDSVKPDNLSFRSHNGSYLMVCSYSDIPTTEIRDEITSILKAFLK